MANYNQTDINKRIQLAYCCIGDLGDIVRKDLLYGKSCLKADFKKLKKAIVLLKAICNYTAISSATSSTGSFSLTGTNGSVKIRVNNVPVSGTVNFNADLNTTTADIVTSINNTTSFPVNYTAVQSPGLPKVTLTAPAASGDQPNGDIITADVTGDMSLSGSNSTLIMAGGFPLIIDGDNCLTETEMQLVFENLSEICKDCYKSPGYSYS